MVSLLAEWRVPEEKPLGTIEAFGLSTLAFMVTVFAKHKMCHVEQFIHDKSFWEILGK
jgi:hypothetical protein